jgi:hypothetical protein
LNFPKLFLLLLGVATLSYILYELITLIEDLIYMTFFVIAVLVVLATGSFSAAAMAPMPFDMKPLHSEVQYA